MDEAEKGGRAFAEGERGRCGLLLQGCFAVVEEGQRRRDSEGCRVFREAGSIEKERCE